MDFFYVFVISRLKQLSHVMKSIDCEINRNLRETGILTRPAKSNGLWCFLLIPCILLSNSTVLDVNLLYKLAACLSVGLIVFSILYIIFMSTSGLVLKESNYGGCIASSLTAALLLYIFMNQDLIYCLAITLPTVYLYNYALRLCLNKCPKTFTIGEAMIVTQGVVLFTMFSISKLVLTFQEANELDLINTIVYTILLTVGFIIIAINLLRDEMRVLKNLALIFIAAIILFLTVLNGLLGIDCIPNIIHYVFMDNIRIQTLALWVTLVTIAIFTLCIRTKMAIKANTVTRKTFHLLASGVFMSGILLDVEFMKFAAGVCFGLIILVEALRKSQIEPISSTLQLAFDVYSDEKDCGVFAMTPIYLYVGLSAPIILVPVHEGHALELLSGVLAIGIGDTAASWFGMKHGINKWNGSDRSLEGTAFNIISQVMTVYVLIIFDIINTKNALLRTAIAATVSGLVEAKTNQVDNLILPFVTLLAFQWTSFLR